MTDETIEQIKKDADAYVKRQGTHNRPDLTHHDFTKGATHQHPISYEAGYKQALIDFEREMDEAMKNNPDLNVEAWMWSILQKNVQNGSR